MISEHDVPEEHEESVHNLDYELIPEESLEGIMPQELKERIPITRYSLEGYRKSHRKLNQIRAKHDKEPRLKNLGAGAKILGLGVSLGLAGENLIKETKDTLLYKLCDIAYKNFRDLMPENVQEWMTQHPTYAAGLLGTFFTGVLVLGYGYLRGRATERKRIRKDLY